MSPWVCWGVGGGGGGRVGKKAAHTTWEEGAVNTRHGTRYVCMGVGASIQVDLKHEFACVYALVKLWLANISPTNTLA